MLYFCKDCSNSDKICVLLTWKNNTPKQFNGILLLGSMTLHCITCMKIELFQKTADMDNGYRRPELGSLIYLGD